MPFSGIFPLKAPVGKPEDAIAMSNRGAALLGLGRHGDALECADGALRAHPDSVQNLRLKAGILAGMGRDAESIVYYDAALGRLPGHPEILVEKAIVLARMGRRKEAIESYCSTLETGSGDILGAAIKEGMSGAADQKVVDHLCERGIALKNAGRPAEAILVYDLARGMMPDYAPLILNRAVALRYVGRLDEALSWIDRYIGA